MAEFIPAYNLERKHEGYYVNNPSDKGGETYAGVARNFWPKWAGWPVLDAHKKQMETIRHRHVTQVRPILQGNVESFSDYEIRLNKVINKLKTANGKILVMPSASGSGRMCCVIHYELSLGRALKWNEQVPGMEPFVMSFYKALWDSKNFSAIKSQDVANIVYDWFINSGSGGIKGTQQVLRDTFKVSLAVDGAMGADTIKNINSQNSERLNDAIKEKRIAFYNSLVAKNPSQATFLQGWMTRINSFPTLTNAGLGLGAILLMAGLFFLITRNAK